MGNKLLDGKAAVVTGAASGIGAASALRFAAEGARVIVGDIRLALAEQTVAEIVARGGVAAAVEVDVHTLRPGTAVELSVKDGDLVMAVNVRSVFLGAKFAMSAGQRLDHQHRVGVRTRR